MGILRLFAIELTRVFVLTVRYPTNFTSSLLVGTLMFYGLFMGARYMSGQEVFGSNLDAMVVGWGAWVMATKCLNKTAMSIQTEAETGVLESVFLSRYWTWLTFLSRAFAETLIDIVLVVIMVVTLTWLTGSDVSFSPALILPALTLIMAATGIGMTAGGIALQVKRISGALPMLQMVLLLLIFTPFETWTTGIESGIAAIAMWMPMVPSVILLRSILAFEGSYDFFLAIQAVVNGAGWLTLGLVVFSLMSRRVKAKGLLAGY